MIFKLLVDKGADIEVKDKVNIGVFNEVYLIICSGEERRIICLAIVKAKIKKRIVL